MDEFTHPIILRRKRRGIKPEVIKTAGIVQPSNLIDPRYLILEGKIEGDF